MARSDSGGFTLLELMVVVLIVGILAGVAIPTFLGARARAQDAAASSRVGATLEIVAAAPETPLGSRTAAWLATQDGSIVADTAPSTGPDRVSSYASDTFGVGVAVRSASGACIGGTVDSSGVVTVAGLVGAADGIDLHTCTGASALWFARRPPTQVPAGTVVVGPNGHGYEVVLASLSWGAAASAAQARQWQGRPGHLATITTPEEQVIVRSLATPTSAPWIGATDAAAEGTWTWATGPEAGTPFVQVSGGVVTDVGGAFHAFRSTQPNDSGGAEDCALIERFASAKSVWNDVSCTQLRSYVTEYS